MKKISKFEQQLENILTYQDKELKDISFPDKTVLDMEIAKVEHQLRSLGIDYSTVKKEVYLEPKRKMIVPSWERLCVEAEKSVGTHCKLKQLFTEKELINNRTAIKALNQDYSVIHRLDKIDISIAAFAAIIGGAVDLLMVGIPKKGKGGLEAGPLSDFIRKKFEEAFPPEELQKLASSKYSKVPYDAQDNRNTTEYVKGLSAYYHRLLSLGHDPLLGFVVGVFDIITGKMTTIDKSGKLLSQIMEEYADRKECDVFLAIAKQLMHLKSDLTTSMGLPAPLMGLFNFLQFGSISEEELTIAEIVQGMYYEGYDFVHFCSLSIPVMIVEVIIRVGYAIKRIKEGRSIKESIPISLDRNKHPKLSTMLFIGHTGAVSINLGKICFIKNPMAINYPQWIAFARYSYKQLKWTLIEKPEMQEAYVNGKLFEDLKGLTYTIDCEFRDFSKGYIVVMDTD